MAILNRRRYFLDTLVEMIGIKSGLAVSIPEALQLLEYPPDGGGKTRMKVFAFIWRRSRVPSSTCCTILATWRLIPNRLPDRPA